MTTKVEISHRTIIFTVLFLAGLWLVYLIKDILFLLFISFIFMCALRPLVDLLERLRIPRIISIVFVYILIFVLFGFSFAGAIPSLVLQTTRLVQELPVFVTKVLPQWNIDVGAITQQIAPISENIVKVTVGFFSNLITTVTVLVFTFYFLLERKHADLLLGNMVGEEAAGRVVSVLRDVEQRLGSWVQGELILMTIIGIFSYIGLTILRVDFALPLAIIAGLLEAVPMIGPIISAVPAILVALASSQFLALSVVALYFIIQQIENNVIVPFVMKRSVGLPPLLTILSLMIGGRLGGITGAVLSVPVVLVLQVLFRELLLKSSKAK